MSNTLPTGYLIKRVQAAFRQRLDTILEAHDLSTATYAALHHLTQHDALSSAALARACGVSAQTMHRLTTTLQETGFIRAQPLKGRTIHLGLTTLGERAFRLAQKDVAQLEATMVEGLSTKEQSTLTRLLTHCHNALTE